jgi:malonyl-CoA O-methyltransferase
MLAERLNMRLNPEYLPATGSAAVEIVLLHGWGSNRDIWRPLLAALRPWASVTLLDIPGCSPASACPAEPELVEVMEFILETCPPEAVYMGWSLGGQLAVELAARNPDRVQGVVTVCSNPRFVAQGEWPGMDEAVFSQFLSAVGDNATAALRRFDSLQVRGAHSPRNLLRRLPGRGRAQASPALLAGLGWLGNLEQRQTLAHLEQPQLHFLAGRDALVPPALGAELEALLQGGAAARVQMLPECSHVAPLEAADTLAGSVETFLSDTGLLRPAPDEADNLVKREVAESFSRAAGSYDSVASLQRDVGTRLLDSLDQGPREPSAVLDLGCGTGYFCPELRRRYPEALYIGLDLAQGMVDYARAQHPGDADWLVGDAEALPLASESVDLVFSSLAIQWCDHPRLLFAELARVLRPGGACVFTSLGPDTLRELRAAWAAVDSHQHVNSFTPSAALEEAALDLPGVHLELHSAEFRMEYHRVRELLDELKALGAHNMNRDRPAGLTSRRALQGMLRAYEDWREDGLLPATYDVIFGVLEKR